MLGYVVLNCDCEACRLLLKIEIAKLTGDSDEIENILKQFYNEIDKGA